MKILLNGEYLNVEILEISMKYGEIFQKYPITAVMQFAAFTYVGESVEDPQKYYRNNVCNTLNLIKVMLEFDVKTLVFSSTCATYGNPIEIPITEQHPQNPISPYGRGKLMVENYIIRL